MILKRAQQASSLLFSSTVSANLPKNMRESKTIACKKTSSKCSDDAPIDPPPVLTALIQRTAHYVSTHGLGAEKMFRDRNLKDARYSFLRSSDPFHPLYQRMLTEYAEEPTDSDPCDESTDDKREGYPQPDPQSPFWIQADSLQLDKLKFSLPDGMAPEEFDTINLAAQFVGWYGKCFWECLTKRVIMNHEFEFMKPTDSRYTVFTRLIAAYKRVLMPADEMEDMLREYGAYMATILEVFFHFMKQQCHEEVAMALTDWVGLMNKFEFPPAQIQQPGMLPPLGSLFPQLPPPLMGMMQPPTMSLGSLCLES